MSYLAMGLDDVWVLAPQAGMVWGHLALAPAGDGDPPEGAVIRSGVILGVEFDATGRQRLAPGVYAGAAAGWWVTSHCDPEPLLWHIGKDGRALVPPVSRVHPMFRATLHWIKT